MSSSIILTVIFLYFLGLFIISNLTTGNDDNQTFFSANKESPWYLVAFGMVGASLSGITFISVPGDIGSTQFTYFQVVLGYLFGYFVVALLLLPIYYKLNLTSIYEYLKVRFGKVSHKTGAFFFFLSRITGASFRLYLVAIVLQQFVFNELNIPFEITVVLSVLLIWIYTFRGGIKTIVWTDTLQTSFMIVSVILSIYLINQSLNWTFIDFINSDELKTYSNFLVTDSFLEKNYFLKSFIGGMFITICMTGLDQDMMQKNLTCKSLKEAQKNMIVFSIVLVVVTFIFLLLGALLFIYSEKFGIMIPKLNGSTNTDLLFPEIALNSNLGNLIGITFLLGLIAAAYSSADSALTSLTTSYCVDIIDIKDKTQEYQTKIRKRAHLVMSSILVLVIIIFDNYLNRSVIDGLLVLAGYTYGPLLGLFSFGIFTNYKVNDQYVWIVTIFSVILVSFLANLDPSYLGGYKIGYELLPINGLITFLGLILIRRK
ncbi:MAG: sodium:solute symporter [Cryomorphaceae bacterium]|nr:MAG: sodium:solute symporter [Cryomorphaceae bacterium]|tara:strand:+ start:3282 stop:4739 length:1458 start_codon:yes stop_codon:yes gene_type:complete